MLEASTVTVHDNWREDDGQGDLQIKFKRDGSCSLGLCAQSDNRARTIATNLLLSSAHSLTSKTKEITYRNHFQSWYVNDSAAAASLFVYKHKAPVITGSLNLWCSSQLLYNTKTLFTRIPSIVPDPEKVDIAEVKSKWKISSYQRGKWVITRESIEQRGNSMTLDKVWKRICGYIQAGHLPYANAVLKIPSKRIFVFCDFRHSLKVWSALRYGLGKLGTVSFEVHPHGSVMTL